MGQRWLMPQLHTKKTGCKYRGIGIYHFLPQIYPSVFTCLLRISREQIRANPFFRPNS